MLIQELDRPSDSPHIERVWRYHSEKNGSFLSIAESRSEIVVTRYHGEVMVTVRGPETRVTRMQYNADAEWMGIRFKPGVFLPSWPARSLVNRGVNLPLGVGDSFWLDGSTWELPESENAETFVARLVRAGHLVIDPAILAALGGDMPPASLRTVQRRFVHTTGITRSFTRQIERARYAALLLMNGTSIADVTHEAGYFDQPHLTRSMRRLIGQTPAELHRDGCEQLSFLYKTGPFLSS